MAHELLVDMENVEKSFSGVKVLTDGSLKISTGQIHALMGANGAGKSTLMKILVGVYSCDAGTIRIADPGGDLREVHDLNPRSMGERGISIVHQELILLDDLTISENIVLGAETSTRFGLIDEADATAKARAALDQVGLAGLSPARLVRSLPTAQKQLVEIARAVSSGGRVIVLDEPTTSLSAAEAANLMDILCKLRDQGVAIVYISHRMDEIFALTDHITVMRDGAYIGQVETAATTRDELVRMMIGRDLQRYESELDEQSHTQADTPVVLEVSQLGNAALHDVSLTLHQGEVVGLFGLVGAGRTELARAVFGIDTYDSGTVTVAGQPLAAGSPAKAAAAGIGLVPEERKVGGLVLSLPNIRNMELAGLRRWRVWRRTARDDAELWATYAESLGIVARGPQQETGRLSGGNQQKIVLAKWLALHPSILILDEPTKGIDVGAKQDIYEQIHRLAAQGMSILVISSESEEIRMLSDRVIVMREGSVTYEGVNHDLDDETLLRFAMGEVA
ncbi:MAG: sugar ABC transporter ATP-binding protein [Arachnia sp.]